MRYARQMCRFIPTHVGNSRVNLLKKMLVTVHPHACGELERMMKKLSICVGSSPRMWGTPHVGCRRHADDRFIPTHVGNSVMRWLPLARSSVHPHACGELPRTSRSIRVRCGSSPRMWGTRLLHGGAVLDLRFIPTHVGNSGGRRGHAPPGSVHPHACGELSSYYYSEKEKSFYPPAGYCHTWDRPPELPWAPA